MLPVCELAAATQSGWSAADPVVPGPGLGCRISLLALPASAATGETAGSSTEPAGFDLVSR
jgi:hypothetical protein